MRQQVMLTWWKTRKMVLLKFEGERRKERKQILDLLVSNDHAKDPPCMQPDDVEEVAIAGMKPTPTRVNSGTFYNCGLNVTKQKEKGTGATSVNGGSKVTMSNYINT
uniref:Uncharacterized protein n=1 Tax=Tanacetum cinerariifolium TaxID=118510 RepID=A0A699H1H2_TANCI|nr:hypothetical protein [Tanacetum cinerariifolium]